MAGILKRILGFLERSRLELEGVLNQELGPPQQRDGDGPDHDEDSAETRDTDEDSNRPE